MTTATQTKTPVQVTWNLNKIQQETVESFARNMAVTMSVLEKLGPQAIAEFQKASSASKAAHYKTLGVKTPIDLVKAMAEFETNVLGSKIKVWGDEKEAHLEYEMCACFNAMQKIGMISEKNQEQMGQGFASCLANTAKEFGFSKGEVKFGTNSGEPCATITFVK